MDNKYEYPHTATAQEYLDSLSNESKWEKWSEKIRYPGCIAAMADELVRLADLNGFTITDGVDGMIRTLTFMEAPKE